MKNLNKMLLRDLFKSSEGLYIFTLYKRFNVSPKDLFISINELKNFKHVIEEDGRLILSSEGKNFIINNNIIIKKTTNKFDKIPEDFLGKKIEVNEFYLPKYLEIKNKS